MAGRRGTPPKSLVLAQTPGITDPALQRAFDVVSRAIQDLQSRRHLEQFTATDPGYVPESGGSAAEFLAADGTWKPITGSGAVDSVTAGGAMVTASPTTGAVVINVVPANFVGIPEAGVSGLVADLAARPTGAPAASSGLSARWVSTTVLGDGAFIDDGTNATSLGYLRVTGDFSVATSKFTVASATGNTAVAGTLDSAGNFSVATNKFTVAAATGNTLVAGTLTISPMTQGSVLFAGASGVVSQNNANFYWNDSAKKLGIGSSTFLDNTAFPGGATVPLLQVVRDGVSTQLAVASYGTSLTPGFFCIGSRGTQAAPTATQSGDIIGVFNASGQADTSVNHFGTGASIQMEATNSAWTASSFPARMRFFTVPSGSTTPTERLKIDHDGTSTFANNVVVNGLTTLGSNTATANAVTISGPVTITSTASQRPLHVKGTLDATSYLVATFNANSAAAGSLIQITDGTNYNWGVGGTVTSGNFEIRDGTFGGSAGTARFRISKSTGDVSVLNALGVTGLSTLTGGFTLGADSSAASHKITNLTNGSSAQDAAAFGQIATAVNAAVSGTTNQTAKFTGTNTIGNAWATDDGTTWGVASVFTITEANGNFHGYGTGAIDGNTTIGSAVSAVHAISGNVVLTDDSISSGSLRLNITPVNATAVVGMVVNQAGTLDTTAASRFSQGIQSIVSSTVGAGANSLTNRGVYASAMGGTTNYAFFSDFGDNRFNASGGSTLFSRDVQINGNATIGDAAGDSHVINGTATFNHAVTVKGNATIGDAAGDAHTINGTATFVDGVTMQSTLAVNGNTTLGDAVTDAHTINGNVTVVENAAGSVTALTLSNTDSGATTSEVALDFSEGGTVYQSIRAKYNSGGGGQYLGFQIDGGSGLTERMRIDGNGLVSMAGALDVTGTFTSKGTTVLCDGTGDTLKFYGGTGATQQTITGSRGGNAALADLLTKLATLGLIVDSTTA